MASTTKQLVMMKVLKVEEGVMEMIVEKRWNVVGGEGGKKVTKSVGRNGLLKSIPMMDESVSQLKTKSDDHMLLPYVPYMKRMHPRASATRMCEFEVEGSNLVYRPSPSEFEVDEERSAVIGDPHECKGCLFFRMEGAKPVLDAEGMQEMKQATSAMEAESPAKVTSPAAAAARASTRSLWICNSIQSGGRRDVNPMLRCEEIGTGVTEDIPLASLTYAKRIDDAKAVHPYTAEDELHTAATMQHATKTGHKTSLSKKGKGDADPTLHHSSLPLSNF